MSAPARRDEFVAAMSNITLADDDSADDLIARADAELIAARGSQPPGGEDVGSGA